MIIGIPKETKQHEYRVSVLPVGVELLTKAGHQVLVQTNAGVGSGYEDRDYEQAGATLIDNAEEVFGKADMIVKVKEPLKDEWPLLRQNQIVFTYFHFAASHEQGKSF